MVRSLVGESAAGDQLSEDVVPRCASVDSSPTRHVEKMPRLKAVQTDAGVLIKLDCCLLSSFTTLMAFSQVQTWKV